MRIERRHLALLADQVIYEYLVEQGRMPTLLEIKRGIQQRLDGRAPGTPTLKHRPAVYHGRSSSADWRAMAQEVGVDLRTLYGDIMDQVNALSRNFQYLETRRVKLEHRLRQVQKRIRELLLLTDQTNGYFATAFDTFTDLTHVDLEKTSAWINLEAGEATPPIARTGNRQIAFQSPSVSFKVTPDLPIQHVYDISQIWDGHKDTFWIARVDPGEKVAVTLTIEITSLDESGILLDGVNRFELYGENSQATRVTLEESEDGVNYLLVGEALLGYPTVFQTEPLQVRKLRITLHQESPSAGDTVHVFGLREIRALGVGYETYGVLVSKPWVLKDAKDKPIILSKVALDVDEEVPRGCQIDYYVALDDGQYQWQPILPTHRTSGSAPKVVDLKRITRSTPWVFNADTAVSIGRYAGLLYYSMGTISLPDGATLIPETLRLDAGQNQWFMEYFFATKPSGANPIPSMADWDMPANVTRRYTEVTTDFLIPAGQGVNQKFTTFIKVPEPVGIRWEFIPDKEISYAVMLGDAVLKSDTTSKTSYVDLSLEPGIWHEVTILFYAKTGGVAVRTDQRLTDYGTCFGRDPQNPMKLVSDYDLLYNVPAKNTDCYAVDSSRRVLINEETKKLGGRYALTGSYYTDGTPGEGLLFKAEMRGRPDRPPKIRQYTLRATY